MAIKPVSGMIESQELNNNFSYLDSRVSKIITTPTEGVNAEEIVDAREGQASLGSNIRDIRSNIETNIKNSAFNGDFSQGTDGTLGWAFYTGADYEGGENEIIMTGDGAHKEVRIRQTDGYGISELQYNIGDKYYVKAEFTVLNKDATGIGMVALGSDVGGTHSTVVENNPKENTTYNVSGIFELNGGAGKLILQFKTFYRTKEEAAGKKTKLKNVVVINLTESFGKGFEPNLKDMNYMINLYPNRFFEKGLGVNNLIDYLYNNNQSVVGDIKNGARNGRFESDDYWGKLTGASLDIFDNTAFVTGTGDNSLVRAYQRSRMPYTLGDKIYIRGEFEVDNTKCKKAGFYLSTIGNASANATFFQKTAPMKDEIFIMSGIMENLDNEGSDDVAIYIRADYEDNISAKNTTIKARNVLAINLTEAFGKENEPTDREYLDDIIKRYPNNFFESNPSKKDWDSALMSHSLSYQKGIRKPLIVFGIDDGSLTDYMVAYPLFKRKGIRGSSYLVNKWVDGNPERWMQTEQIQEMHADVDKDGRHWWDFQCHTANHNHFTDYQTDEEIRAEFEENNALFERLELPYPEHHVYPFGNYNQNVMKIALEYRKTARATGTTSGLDYNEYDRLQRGAINARSIDIVEGESDRLNEIKKAIDETVKRRGVLVLYMHELKEVPDREYQAQISVVEEIIDYALLYINKGKLESVTHKEAMDAIESYNK